MFLWFFGLSLTFSFCSSFFLVCFFFALRTLQRMFFFLIFQIKWPVFPKMSSLPSDKHTAWIISCISENQSPGGRRILLQDVPPQPQWTIVSLDLIRFIHAARQRTRCQDLIKRMYATNPIRIRSESQSRNSTEDYSSCYRAAVVRPQDPVSTRQPQNSFPSPLSDSSSYAVLFLQQSLLTLR